MQELGGFGWVWGVREHGEEMGVMGEDRNGFGDGGVGGIKGLGNDKERGDRLGRRGSAALRRFGRGLCCPPHLWEFVQPLNSSQECPAVLGADQNLGSLWEPLA